MNSEGLLIPLTKRVKKMKVSELKGHKSLYSDVYYSEDEFWKMYSKEHYQRIKQKYDPKSLLKDWYRKVKGALNASLSI